MNRVRLWIKQSRWHRVIAILVIAYIIQWSLELVHQWGWWAGGHTFLHEWIALGATAPVDFYKIWTPLTYGLLHGDFFHILLNAVALYFVGDFLKGFWKEDRVIWLFITGIMAGGLIRWAMTPVLGDGHLVGASAGLYAILTMAALTAPNMPIRFFVMDVPLRILVLVVIGVSVLNLLANDNPGGNLAHLGGVIWAVAVYRNPQWLPNTLPEWLNRPHSRRPKRPGHLRVVRQDPEARNQRLDDILDKLGKVGYDGLNAQEKKFLSDYGKK